MNLTVRSPTFLPNLGKRIIKSPKVHFSDLGIVCYLTGIRDETHLLQGPLAGALFENFCVQEALKVFFNQGQTPRIYYLRIGNNLEIDLLIERSARSLIPVEIKLSKTPSPGMGSAISRFRSLFSAFDIGKGFIVSLAEQTVPLSRELTAITFDDYLKEIAKGAA